MSILQRWSARATQPPQPVAAPVPEPETPPMRVPSTLDHEMLEEYTYWHDDDGYGPGGQVVSTMATSDPHQAVSITSRLTNASAKGRELHAPILDIDFHAAIVPSSTPGHHHLYLDVEMSWRTYRRLLKALARAGVIEESWAKASIASGRTYLSPPWKHKSDQGAR